jgi:hypothetical protein
LILALYQDVLDGTRVNLLLALMAGLPFLAAVRSSYAQRISERTRELSAFSRIDRLRTSCLRCSLILIFDCAWRRPD